MSTLYYTEKQKKRIKRDAKIVSLYNRWKGSKIAVHSAISDKLGVSLNIVQNVIFKYRHAKSE